MRLGSAAVVSAVALWVAAGCGGEEFASKSGTGGAAGSGGESGGGGTTGGAGGATGGSGGVTAGAGGVIGGTGGATGGTGGATGGTGGATGGTGGATGGTGGLPACGGGVCAPAVPGGWSGPIAIIDAAAKTAATCSGAYPSEVLFAHDQLSGTPPAAQCGCSCDASGVACSNIRIDAYVAGTCSGAACCGGTACTTVSLASGACVAAGASLCSGVTHAQIKADVNKSCTPSTLTNLDNIDWTRTIRGCAPASSSSCSSGTCVPHPGSPTTGRVCIYKDGDNSCSGAYSQKIATWETLDQRTCSNTCGCLAPSCGSLQPYSAQNCASPLGNPAPVPMNCAAPFAGSNVQSAKFTSAAPSCTTYGTPTPGGEVQQDAVTICCLPG